MAKQLKVTLVQNDALIETDTEITVRLDGNAVSPLLLGLLFQEDTDLALLGMCLETLVRTKETDSPIYQFITALVLSGVNIIDVLREKGYYTDEHTLGIKNIKIVKGSLLVITLVRLPVLRQCIDLPLMPILKDSLELNDEQIKDAMCSTRFDRLITKSELGMDIADIYFNTVLDLFNDRMFVNNADAAALMENRILEELVDKAIIIAAVEKLQEIADFAYLENIRLRGDTKELTLRITYTVPVVDA